MEEGLCDVVRCTVVATYTNAHQDQFSSYHNGVMSLYDIIDLHTTVLITESIEWNHCCPMDSNYFSLINHTTQLPSLICDCVVSVVV